MAETLELKGVLEELKKQGVDVQIEDTSEDLFEIVNAGNGQCGGACSQGGCSGGSGYRSPESFSENEKIAA